MQGHIPYLILFKQQTVNSKQTSTNWCILVAKLNIPSGLNHHLQHPTACSIQNDRLGLEICQTLSFWIRWPTGSGKGFSKKRGKRMVKRAVH